MQEPTIVETGKLVSTEEATKEVNSWLDFKKVGPSKREANKEQINLLIESVSDGTVTFKEDKTIIQNLKFPVEGDIVTKTLEFKPRLKINEVHQNLQGVNSSNADQRILAYVAALTGKPKAFFTKLDTEDYTLPQSIAIFFL
ncbi:MAG TPA: hypothetical protein VN922_19580 [Bacteroidia bacterium]|nr:hypothetical protein [Bacteroidia bacterium]